MTSSTGSEEAVSRKARDARHRLRPTDASARPSPHPSTLGELSQPRNALGSSARAPSHSRTLNRSDRKEPEMFPAAPLPATLTLHPRSAYLTVHELATALGQS